MLSIWAGTIFQDLKLIKELIAGANSCPRQVNHHDYASSFLESYYYCCYSYLSGLMGYKLYVLDYPLKGLMPVVSYQVELAMQLEGYGGDINVRTFLPRSDSRQRIIKGGECLW